MQCWRVVRRCHVGIERRWQFLSGDVAPRARDIQSIPRNQSMLTGLVVCLFKVTFAPCWLTLMLASWFLPQSDNHRSASKIRPTIFCGLLTVLMWKLVYGRRHWPRQWDGRLVRLRVLRIWVERVSNPIEQALCSSDDGVPLKSDCPVNADAIRSEDHGLNAGNLQNF